MNERHRKGQEDAPHITVRPHRDHPETHSLVEVEVRDRIYAADWAGTPSVEEAAEAWRTDRSSFMPYNQSTGRYCDRKGRR